ncbi:capsular polysaccharide biosynthesis protein [Sinorhizobium meliloti]|uniref:capsular polysaccharide biosynthesis protein n=1 Tax=Sinorhizobium TaxID=28105 RepID=UPI0001E4BCA5|nr:capsular polysaccharide biosynthesis protein [Sinorhizobium meliloti]AEG08367.1 Capsule polysaccharide biosynthesis protein [Sinorhizobium meliloti BL225C]MCO6425619.1 capsular polysaccharide biosynthesis protein [Sinorhizobium meliloti]MDE4549358.1 capsular polysaccharide biosynthesis protein [Sinorhizobium meliloti]MDE4569647.1 capsular polysaccharide biosynthesis protein [Sinorhizobium meliloti]
MESLSWLIERTSRTPPLFLPLDRRALYFDCRHSLRLEELLKTYEGPALMARARAGIALLTESCISSIMARVSARRGGPGEKTRKRVLVAGQVEDHASIRYGCLSRMTNNDLGAARGLRASGCPDPLQAASRRARPPMRTVDHVNTITSLAGFEALLRGIRGYHRRPVASTPDRGLTNDRQPNPAAGARPQGPTPPKWRILASS